MASIANRSRIRVTVKNVTAATRYFTHDQVEAVETGPAVAGRCRTLNQALREPAGMRPAGTGGGRRLDSSA